MDDYHKYWKWTGRKIQKRIEGSSILLEDYRDSTVIEAIAAGKKRRHKTNPDGRKLLSSGFAVNI